MEALIPGKIYHIYNHANGNEKLFIEPKNYQFFLLKYQKHITPIAHTYCYCLLPNHFHILLKVKEEINISASKAFSNLFSSYTQSFNKVYRRRGSLFIKNFKRKIVEDEDYLLKLINYIHFNPVTHSFVDLPKQWKYSSFNTICSDKKTLLHRKEVIEWFDGLDNFLFNHQIPIDLWE